MIYSGSAITVAAVGDGIVELKLDLAGESINLMDFAVETTGMTNLVAGRTAAVRVRADGAPTGLGSGPARHRMVSAG